MPLACSGHSKVVSVFAANQGHNIGISLPQPYLLNIGFSPNLLEGGRGSSCF